MSTVSRTTEVVILTPLELRTLIEQTSEGVFEHPQSFESLRNLYAEGHFPDVAGSLYLKSLLKMALEPAQGRHEQPLSVGASCVAV